jgi:hypothetical protein
MESELRDTAPVAIGGVSVLEELKATGNLEVVRASSKPKVYRVALLAEVSRYDSGYEPQPVGALIRKADGTLTNRDGIFFPKALKGWGKVSAMSLIDEAGKHIVGGPLSQPRTHPAGETLVFPPGMLEIPAELASRFEPFEEEAER